MGILGTLHVIGVLLSGAVGLAALCMFVLGVAMVSFALTAMIFQPLGIAMLALGVDTIRSGLHPRPMWRPSLRHH